MAARLKFYDSVIVCAAPYAQGGLGRHFEELVAARLAGGESVLLMAKSACPVAPTRIIQTGWARRLALWTPLRQHPGWRHYLEALSFDAQVARLLPPAKRLWVFDGHALRTLRQAERLGFESRTLVASLPHARLVERQTQAAFSLHPIGRREILRRHLLRIEAEYKSAASILCSTAWQKESFLEAGIDAKKLSHFGLSAHPRFSPAPRKASNGGVFHIVYVGSISVTKGVPLLVEVFHDWSNPQAKLTLVGGTGHRAMRLWLKEQLRDQRIQTVTGDPLPFLREAHLLAHPSYFDSCGYAPLEALACGVRVAVTHATGMKEKVQESKTGWVVPTGNKTALDQAIKAAARLAGVCEKQKARFV